MSSANEEMHPPSLQQSKPRVSPLEFRNTDLVSRLLAATPPYLYNMPLVPHTYFFSEMLRSFVQAKTDGSRNHSILPQRRTRKRSWTNVSYHKQEQKHQESAAVKDNMPPPPNWTPKMYLDKNQHCNVFDKPLELTMNKNLQLSKSHLDLQSAGSENNITTTKSAPMLSFPGGNAGGAQQDLPQQDQMVLPPPPPLWYPPLYPPGNSYSSTFDPLHFFIDLRVSGHIYDRKTATSNKDSENVENQFASPLGGFKQSRHCSAFSLPNNHSTDANCPINLMTNPSSGDSKTKFDVKSMGFDKTDSDSSSSNKTSTNYIMQNIDGIYKNINSFSADNNAADESEKDADDEKQKEKDLRALIGLELVVDYMSHTKKKIETSLVEDEDVKDVEDSCSRGCSPAVEVVAVTDNDSCIKYG